MSRSGYGDDCENWAIICWRGAVASGIRGKRGQAFLREMLKALDELEQHELITDDLEREGKVCALGAVGVKRGLDMSKLDPYESDQIAEAFGISRALACEIVYMNDEAGLYWNPDETVRNRNRYERMRRWVIEHINGDLPSTAVT